MSLPTDKDYREAMNVDEGCKKLAHTFILKEIYIEPKDLLDHIMYFCQKYNDEHSLEVYWERLYKHAGMLGRYGCQQLGEAKRMEAFDEGYAKNQQHSQKFYDSAFKDCMKFNGIYYEEK